MNDKINITLQDGTSVQSDLICLIENLQTKKRYLYHTLNEKVGTGPNSTVKIIVSKIKQNNPTLDQPITDVEWKFLKDIMAETLKGLSNNMIKYIPISEITEGISVSDKMIAMPVSYDYVNKQKGVYAQAIAKESTQVINNDTVGPNITNTASAPIMPAMPEVNNIVNTSSPIQNNAAQLNKISSEELNNEVISGIEPIDSVNNAPIGNLNVNNDPVSEVKNVQTISNNINEKIDLQEVEQKFQEMEDYLKNLKAKTIEAVNRYNDTLDLNIMHTEQHANYVANEQTKENEQIRQSITIEPKPVTPIIPEPVTNATNGNNLETNWFDMPA